jgi:hypothetical protein
MTKPHGDAADLLKLWAKWVDCQRATRLINPYGEIFNVDHILGVLQGKKTTALKR